MRVCKCVCVCACVRASVHVCVHTYMRVCVFVCAFVNVRKHCSRLHAGVCILAQLFALV